MKRTSLLASLCFVLPAVYATAATLTFGHVDAIGIGYDGTDLEPHVHAENATVDGVLVADGEYAPDEVAIVVPASTFNHTTTTGGRAAGPEWNPIGVAAGQSYWFLPQGSTLSNSLGAPFAGIAAEELNPADWSGNLTVKLTAANMPIGGQFSLNRTDGLGVPTFYMATLGGISGTDSLEITPGAHRHYNWYFTAEGTYDLTFEISGTHLTDGAKSSSATFSFNVVPEPSAGLLGALGAFALLRRRRN